MKIKLTKYYILDKSSRRRKKRTKIVKLSSSFIFALFRSILILILFFIYIFTFRRQKKFPTLKKENNPFSVNKTNYNISQKFYLPKMFGNVTLEISFDYEKAIKEQMNKKVNKEILNSFPKNKLKFALCAVGKLENLYARDFVIHYLELGVDKIFIYDNNEEYGEKFEDVLQDFIDKEYVKIINKRGNQTLNIQCPQNIFYTECYHEHINEYDWFMFFDFDEYLYIQNYTLNDFVQLPLYSHCSSMIFFWRHATDNNQLYYSPESPMKRFPFLLPENFQRENHNNEKSMSKGGIKELTHNRSVHAPFFVNDTYNTKYILCNTEGKLFDKFQKDSKIFRSYITYKNAYLIHFHWRSTEEYCIKLGIRKYFKIIKWGQQSYFFLKSIYLNENKRTKEKEIMLNKCINLNYYP